MEGAEKNLNDSKRPVLVLGDAPKLFQFLYTSESELWRRQGDKETLCKNKSFAFPSHLSSGYHSILKG